MWGGFAKQGESQRYAWEKVLWCQLLEGVKKSQGWNILFVLGLVFGFVLREKAKFLCKPK